jgi:hypothetical protein
MSIHKEELLAIIADWNAGKPVKVVSMGGPAYGNYYESIIWTCVFCCVLNSIDDGPPESTDGYDHYHEEDPVWDAYAARFGESARTVIDGLRKHSSCDLGIPDDLAAVALVTARALLGHGMADYLAHIGASEPDRLIELTKLHGTVTTAAWTGAGSARRGQAMWVDPSTVRGLSSPNT